MNFEDQFNLPVSASQAWDILMDVPRVAPCLPGAAIESGEGNDYRARIKVKLGPIELTYRGTVTIVERDDAKRQAVIDVAAKEIKGAGGAKARMMLRADPIAQGTRVSVSSEFMVSGKAAQFGRGVTEEVGKALMVQFAQRLSALLTQESTAGVDAAVSQSESDSASAAVSARPFQATSASQSAETQDALDVGQLMRGVLWRRAGWLLGVIVVLTGLVLILKRTGTL